MRRRCLTLLLLPALLPTALVAQKKDYLDVRVDLRLTASCGTKPELVRTSLSARLEPVLTPTGVSYSGVVPLKLEPARFTCPRQFVHLPTGRAVAGESRFRITPEQPNAQLELRVLWPSQYMSSEMTGLSVNLNVGTCLTTDHAAGRKIAGGGSGYHVLFSGGTQDGHPVGNAQPPAPRFTKADVERGFGGTYTLRGQAVCAMMQSDGSRPDPDYVGAGQGDVADAVATVTLNYRQPSAPRVAIEPCSDIVAGQPATVSASGSPAGGRYSWTATGGLTVNGTGARATLLGDEAGRGTVKVEYTSAGRTVSDEQSITCIEVKGVNGGAPIPQIGLYDVQGRPITTPLQVSVEAAPADARDRLSFTPTDAAVLSVTSRGDALLLQGANPGRTLIQAKTSCGQQVGNGWPVEVKRCTDDVVKKIEEERRIAAEAVREQVVAISQALGSDEFTKAADGLAGKSGDLILKTGTMIIGTLGGMKGAGAGVKTAADIMGHASSFKDALTASDLGEGASTVLGEFVQLKGGPIQQTIAGGIDLVKTAYEFGEMLGKVAGTNEVIENSRKLLEHFVRVLEDAERRYRICKGPPTSPPGSQGQQPPPGQQPQPNRPGQQQQTQPGQQGEPAEPPANPSTQPKTPPGDGPSPPPPTSSRGPTGLPFEPEGRGACSCSRPAAGNAPGSATNLATVRTGLQGLGRCNDTFAASAAGYTQALQDYDALLGEVAGLERIRAAQRAARKRDWTTRLDRIIASAKGFDQAGRNLLRQGESCPVALDAAMDVVRRATGAPQSR